MTAVQVSVRTVHLNLPICQAPQSGRQRRGLFADHRGVAHQDNIGFQQLFMVLQERLQTRRTDLFFPLKDELHITVQLACLRHVLKGFRLNHRLALVIICSTGIESSVTDLRLPRVRFP